MQALWRVCTSTRSPSEPLLPSPPPPLLLADEEDQDEEEDEDDDEYDEGGEDEEAAQGECVLCTARHLAVSVSEVQTHLGHTYHYYQMSSELSSVPVGAYPALNKQCVLCATSLCRSGGGHTDNQLVFSALHGWTNQQLPSCHGGVMLSGQGTG